MRKENILVIILFCIAVGGIMAYQDRELNKDLVIASEGNDVVTDNAAITWYKFKQGMATADQSGKPVFLYFYADWCTYCTKLKQTTFKDEKVLAYLKQNFISIAVDADQEKTLVKQWQVRGLPTLWFLEKDGEKISHIPGYIDGDQFLKALKYIRTQKYKTIDFMDFLNTL